MIIIFGGIGSGKSVVCRILRSQGFGVYDCDCEARRLMETDIALRTWIIGECGADSYTLDGTLNRKVLAERLFGDSEFRAEVNGIVHSLVRDDIKRWLSESDRNLFVESAIPATADMLEDATAVWLVECPDEERIKRVMQRNALSREEVCKRIESQRNELQMVLESGVPVNVINNDGTVPLLSQICEKAEKALNL